MISIELKASNKEDCEKIIDKMCYALQGCRAFQENEIMLSTDDEDPTKVYITLGDDLEKNPNMVTIDGPIGNIEIKYCFYVVYIDASCDNVSCYENIKLACSVKVHYPVSFPLAAVAVKDSCGYSRCRQLLADFCGLNLCIAEDYGFP